MPNSVGTWKPTATKLIDEMVANSVSIEKYHLFSYVDTMTDYLSTKDPNQLRNGYNLIKLQHHRNLLGLTTKRQYYKSSN